MIFKRICPSTLALYVVRHVKFQIQNECTIHNVKWDRLNEGFEKQCPIARVIQLEGFRNHIQRPHDQLRRSLTLAQWYLSSISVPYPKYDAAITAQIEPKVEVIDEP